MNEKQITRINGVEILTVERDGEVYVPIKPICAAIGIEAAPQRDKIQNDEFFASTGTIIVSVGADGRQREMFCIRLRDVYGWLATINPGKVAPEAREAVTRYRRECYDVLYEHFAGNLRRQVETNRAEIEALQAVNDAILQVKEAKAAQRSAEEHLAKVRAARLDETPTLFS